MDYISCQFLSGHGKFGEYLSRFRIRSDSYCWCGAAAQDPVHLVCRCPRFLRERSLLEIRSDRSPNGDHGSKWGNPLIDLFHLGHLNKNDKQNNNNWSNTE
ncbi:hypothetical protein DERF_002724 [Dermatophagoides farinae]|uniref:Uncharacterized protein n=1 Tax=Dermatophagoides farinae TaxID=6954 RepID=A0A922IDF9_DERFA|nr:hypothetical protein DERF_002724 [Dermatophagoides farinae]